MKEYLVRKFSHHNIIKHLDPSNLKSIENEIEREINNQTVSTDHIKIISGSNYQNMKYKMHMMLLPNANYTLIKNHLLQAYKVLKQSSNFKGINKVFLISYSNGSIEEKFYTSYYQAYETIFKQNYEISTSVYQKLQEKNSKLKKYMTEFEIHSYVNTIFIEENGTIKEIEDEVVEILEDSEFCFDIHLIFLNILFKDKKIEIIPLWINCSNPESQGFLADALDSYLADDTSLFICTTNLTYFGRFYNYFGENKYKSKSFLKDPKNEEELMQYLSTIDSKVIEAIRNKDFKHLQTATNLLYTRNVFMFALELYCRLEDSTVLEQLAYNSIRQEAVEENEYEINLVSFMSLIFYSKV